jgi:nicotinamide riboside kinase
VEAHVARVVLIGPEASGKTTLARELAEEFGAPWVPEAARLFAESFPEPLSLDTVGPIAKLSMRLEDEAMTAIRRDRATTGADGPPLLFRDTDLVSTVVYSRHYYGTVEPWIVAEARARRAALYLLCRPDLPWLPDGVRDRPMHRERLLEDFRAELVDMGARLVEVMGAGEARRLMARDAVQALVSGDPTR